MIKQLEKQLGFEFMKDERKEEKLGRKAYLLSTIALASSVSSFVASAGSIIAFRLGEHIGKLSVTYPYTIKDYIKSLF